MATEWKSQQGGGKYALQFETNDRDLYKLVEKACQIAMDQEELAKFRDMAKIDHLLVVTDDGAQCECMCDTCMNDGWDMPQCKECKQNGYKWYKEVGHG